MWDMLDEGFVSGIFQIETPGGKMLTEQLKPRSIEDLALLVALNRPGPDSKEFIKRRNGETPIRYDHPILEPILEETYGLFVYEEQIIKFWEALGYSPNDGDAVRKILGKKQPEKLTAVFLGEGEWHGKGFAKVAKENGFSEKVLKKVWDEIADFADYSFNKSHAVCYGVLSLRGLIAKYYAPAEFYMACLRTVDRTKKADLAPEYINEARRLGIEILPPDIRYSESQVSVYDGKIYFGLAEVKGVASGGDFLVEARDDLGYNIASPEDLVADVERYTEEFLSHKKEATNEGRAFYGKSPKQILNEKKVISLYNAGAWDGLGVRQVALREKQKYRRNLSEWS